MKAGDLVKVDYTINSKWAPTGLILERKYDPGEIEWPGCWRCLVLFNDGEKAWIREKELIVVSFA
jgi:hypothetical protein